MAIWKKEPAATGAFAPAPASGKTLKKYIFEADKTQLEKPTEPEYVFCAPARVSVFASDEAEAEKLAEEKLRERYQGSGTALGPVRLAESFDTPEDWSYGYGPERKTGKTASPGELAGKNVIR